MHISDMNLLFNNTFLMKGLSAGRPKTTVMITVCDLLALRLGLGLMDREGTQKNELSQQTS